MAKKTEYVRKLARSTLLVLFLMLISGGITLLVSLILQKIFYETTPYFSIVSRLYCPVTISIIGAGLLECYVKNKEQK